MALDISKLENVKNHHDKITARCPACAGAGGDTSGNHLAIFPDGKFSCVANQGDKVHRKEIFKLVGVKGGNFQTRAFGVKPVRFPKSTAIMTC